jgi:hypothetical protein
MGTLLDAQVGHVRESTWGTPLTVTRFNEWDASGGIKHDAGVKQANPVRVGAIGDRADREYTAGKRGKGTLKFPLMTKGFGLWLESCFGASTSTLVSGSTFQQVHQFIRTGTVLPPLTIQQGHPRPDGTVDPYTYTGCTVDSFEIEQALNDVVMLTVNIDAKDVSTATGLASAAYPAAHSLYEFDQAVTTLGGTLTPPTTTALASISSGTLVTGWRSISMTADSQITDDRWGMHAGGRNQPTYRSRNVNLKAQVEYDSTTLRDAYLNRTTLPLLITWTTSEALSSGFATLQLVIPAMRITNDFPPEPTDGDVPVIDLEAKVFDNLTAMAYVVLRTSDSAL